MDFPVLMGAGRTETARALFGADRKDGGEVYVNGKKVEIKTPMDAVKCGIGYLSGGQEEVRDRRAEECGGEYHNGGAERLCEGTVYQ